MAKVVILLSQATQDQLDKAFDQLLAIYLTEVPINLWMGARTVITMGIEPEPDPATYWVE